MTIDNVTHRSGGRRQLVIGIVLLAIGIVGIVLYVTGVTAELSGAGSDGVTQAGTIIGAALFSGVGALLVVLGVLKRRRR